MNLVEDKEFNELVNNFKKLKTKDKKNIIEKEIQQLIISLQELNKKHNLNSDLLYNQEILDIHKDDATEDDFLEALYVYIHGIENLLGTYIDFLEVKNG